MYETDDRDTFRAEHRAVRTWHDKPAAVRSEGTRAGTAEMGIRRGMLCTMLAVVAGAWLLFAPSEARCEPPEDPPKEEKGHPLDPAIAWAKEGMKKIEGIKDYSATFIKRERIDGKLGERQFMFVKVRHEPFSVYLYYLRPDSMRGREVVYVEGRNNGKMLAHDVGSIRAALGTVSLLPTNTFAMEGNRYPITEIGVKNLAALLIERGEQDKQVPAPCKVRFYKNAKINGRTATCIEVVHPERHPKHSFYKAMIYVDKELDVPVRYEAYLWPEKPGGELPLDEEYTYTRLRVNQGFTDADFDTGNPNYHFP